MSGRSRYLPLVLAVCLWPASVAHAADSVSKDAVLAAWRAIPRPQHGRIEMRRVSLRGSDGKPLQPASSEDNRFVFSSSGRLFRSSRTEVGADPASAGAEDLTVINPAYEAELGTNRPSGPLVLREFRRHQQPPQPTPDRWGMPWLACGNIWLPDWLADSGFEVVRTEQNANGVTRLKFRNTKAHLNPPFTSRADTVTGGWLDLELGRDARVIGYEYEFKSQSSSGRERGVLEYADRPGPPALTRMTAEVPEQLINKHNIRTSSREETTYIFDPNSRVSEDEFYLSYYGLPEPVGVESRRRTSVWKWLGVGAVGLLAAIAARYAWNRRRE